MDPFEPIRAFLDNNELGQYVQAFQDAAFDDLEALSAVTDEDLKELGLPLGHRKKFLVRLQRMQKADEPEVLEVKKRQELNCAEGAVSETLTAKIQTNKSEIRSATEMVTRIENAAKSMQDTARTKVEAARNLMDSAKVYELQVALEAQIEYEQQVLSAEEDLVAAMKLQADTNEREKSQMEASCMAAEDRFSAAERQAAADLAKSRLEASQELQSMEIRIWDASQAAKAAAAEASQAKQKAEAAGHTAAEAAAQAQRQVAELDETADAKLQAAEVAAGKAIEAAENARLEAEQRAAHAKRVAIEKIEALKITRQEQACIIKEQADIAHEQVTEIERKTRAEVKKILAQVEKKKQRRKRYKAKAVKTKQTHIATLEALQHNDPQVEAIVAYSKFVVVSLLQQRGNSPGWRKANIQGPVYVVKRRSAPWYDLYVKDQFGVPGVPDVLHPDWELGGQKNSLFYKVEDLSKRIRGLWFPDECERVMFAGELEKLLGQIRNCNGEPPQPPQQVLRQRANPQARKARKARKAPKSKKSVSSTASSPLGTKRRLSRSPTNSSD